MSSDKDGIVGLAVAAVVVAAALASVYVILTSYDYVYFDEPVRRIGPDLDTLVCDPGCAERAGSDSGYGCLEVAPGEHVCRPARDKDRFWPPEGNNTLHASAAPVTYGEIVLFPEGVADQQIFGVGSVEVVDRASGTVRVAFAEPMRGDIGSIVHSAVLRPGDTFVSDCYPAKRYPVVHLVQYTDLFDMDGVTYAEFWGIHPDILSNWQRCADPGVLQTSLEYDYDLGLPEYGDFSFPQAAQPGG